MLATLKLILRSETEKLGLFQSSNMQGVIMEMIDTAYAEKLHTLSSNPYSQYLQTGEETIWNIQTMNQEAYEQIIMPLLSQEFCDFKIEKKDIKVSILKKELSMADEKEIMREFYEEPMQRYITLEFMTPTSFKQSGHYVIIPDLRLIYQSLMNKISSFQSEMTMFDEDLLQQLTDYSYISDYKLRTVRFPLEGVTVPGFVGNITIRFNGPETLARYVRMLFRYGEYSGIGVKTSIGMGAMRIRRKKYDR